MGFSRFLLGLAISFLLALSAIAVMPLLKIARPDQETAWTASLYVAKVRAAQAVQGPRILVVGGSGTLFSFDAKMASRRTGRSVINFGTHAGLGLPYILDRAARELRPGDVVLLAPEYELLEQNSEPRELMIGQIVFFDRGYMKRVPPMQAFRYLVGYGVINSLVEGVKWLLHGPPPGRSDVSLDALGYVRGNSVSLSKGQSLAHDAPALPMPPVNPGMIADLVAFRQTASAAHARVFVLPPAHISTPGYRSPAFQNFQDELVPLFARLGMPMLASPQSAMLPPQDMYDTEYHANDDGRALYTARMLDKICSAIACTGSPAAASVSLTDGR